MKKVKGFLENTWTHRAHVIMALPGFLILFFIMYVPMASDGWSCNGVQIL